MNDDKPRHWDKAQHQYCHRCGAGFTLGKDSIVCGPCAGLPCKCNTRLGDVVTVVGCAVCVQGHRYTRCCVVMCETCVETLRGQR